MALIQKRLLFTYFPHFLVTRELTQKFLQHMSHLHITHILLTLLTFFLSYQFFKNYEFIVYGFFGAIPVHSCSHHFGVIKTLQNGIAEFKLECLLLIFIYINVKFKVICITPDLE